MNETASSRCDQDRADGGDAVHFVRTGAPAISTSSAAWFLDFDGTLVEIAESPGHVRVDADVLDMVSELRRVSNGAVALISGRRIEDIDRLVRTLRLPVAGQHGAERRDAGGCLWRIPVPGIGVMYDRLRAWVERSPGLLLEHKGSTLAVHYRQVPDQAAQLGTFMQSLVASTHGSFCLQGGKMIFEIRPSRMDKGTAVLEFMREPPFSGRTPVFVGDDITDESAFAAVLSLGGIAVKVGDGDTIAPWRLPGVAEVHAWIRGSISR